MTPPPASTSATTAALVAATAGWNVLQNRVLPRRAYVFANLGGSAAALGAARWLGLDAGALGITRHRGKTGLRSGGAAAAPIVIGILIAERSPLLRRFLRDERASGVTPRGLAFETAVRIPLGTAAFEEVLFRGLLLAWFRSRTSDVRAVTISSALFGLWHILPTWETMAGYAGGALRTRSAATAAAGLSGAVVLTGVAGAGFAWLRLRSGSLFAPIVVHATVNAAGFVAAWRVARPPRSTLTGEADRQDG